MTKEKICSVYKHSDFKSKKEIICQICQKDLQEDEHTLCCYQNFCGECLMKVDKLSPEVCGYDQCSMCEIFNSSQEKTLSLINTIKNGMEIICNSDFSKQLSQTKCTCFDCTNSKTTSYCVVCEKHLCETCQFQHLEKKASDDHQVIAKVSDSFVINVTLFCSDHPATSCQLYCTKCTKVICTICQSTQHSTHETVTITEVFPTVISDVKDELIKLYSACEVAKDTCKIVKLINMSTRENYTKVLKQAKQKLEKEILACEKSKFNEQNIQVSEEEIENKVEILKTDYEILESTLLSNERLNEGKKIQVDLEHEIGCMERLCTWVNVLTSVTQGPGTLHELQSNLRGKIELANKNNNLANAKQYLINMPAKAKFIQSHDKTDFNQIGYIEFLSMGKSFSGKIIQKEETVETIYSGNDDALLNKSYRVSDLDFKSLRKKTVTSVNFSKYKRPVMRMCILGDHIWCAPAYDNVQCIDIYNLGCQYVRSIGLQGVINIVHSLHPLTANRMLVAGNNGLFVMDANTGSITDQILPSIIKDVHCCGDKIAALEKDPDTIHVLSATQPHIPIACFSLTMNKAKTMLLHNQYIYISFGAAGIIKYTFDGEKISHINNTNITLSSDQPFTPYLCMVNELGSLLVTDGPNGRLVVIHEGDCSVIQVPQVKFPRDMVIHKDYMYISRLSELHKYKLT